MKRDRIISDLKLLAAGAAGTQVVFDETYFPTIVHFIGLDNFVRFYSATMEHFFLEKNPGDLLSPFSMTALPDWSDFDTLADAIIKEQKRLAAVAKKNKRE